ncbi:unnamed protein product, partial [Chrysoparadoxa australica]
ALPLLGGKKQACPRLNIMAHNYVVTAQQPTACTHAAVGSFTAPDHTNLVLARSTRLIIHQATPEGLTTLYDLPIYGRIAYMSLYRQAGEAVDNLFLLTEKYQFVILHCDESGEIKTKCQGSVRDRIGRACDSEKIVAIDPQSRMIGLHLYEGMLKVIPVDARGQCKEPFNLHLEGIQEVLDMAFLYGTSKPAIAILYQDNRETRHVKSFTVSSKDKAFANGPWESLCVESNATKLVPIKDPLGGVLVLGQQTVLYYSGTVHKTCPVPITRFTSHDVIDCGPQGARILLGDHFGGLHVAVLAASGKNAQSSRALVSTLHVEPLGETSCSSCLKYISDGIIFVGSVFGDSQLVQLNEEKDEDGQFLEVIENIVNLGPIVDMCMVDADRQGLSQGQGQVVTCSGGNADGTLRVVRSGVGINEQASIELAGIKGMWSLRASSSSAHDKYLVQSFVTETRVLAMDDDDEMAEVDCPNFLSGRTLFCGNVINDLMVQVVEGGVALLEMPLGSGKELHRWSPSDSTHITLATANSQSVVVACTGGLMVRLEVQPETKTLVEKAHTKLDHETSCLALAHAPAEPANKAGEAMDTSSETSTPLLELSSLVAVGLWTDMSVRLLDLETLSHLQAHKLAGNTQARSVALVTFGQQHYFLIGLGDGHVVRLLLDLLPAPAPGSPPLCLSEPKKVTLGTQPIGLTPFTSNGNTCVFVSSDRPTVIYGSNSSKTKTDSASSSKLLFANVNTGEISLAAPFNSAPFPNCLALSNESVLTIGTIDEIQKLHIHTVRLGEQPRRIAHHAEAQCFCLLTQSFTTIEGSDEQEERSFVHFIDDTTYDEIYCHSLNPLEMCSSVACVTFTNDSKLYCVVGTAFVKDDEYEPAEGRLLVFSVTSAEGKGADRKVSLEAEKTMNGAAYVLKSFNGFLLAGVNSKVELYKWSPLEGGGSELKQLFTYSGHILVLYMSVRADFIVVGDLMRSMSLLVYKQRDGKHIIEELARDYNANWMTSVEMLDDDTYIGAENDGNLFTVRRNADSTSDEERSRLEVCGEYHLGAFVNSFLHGSLVMQANETSAAAAGGDEGENAPQPVIFGTVSGMLGVILRLSEEEFSFYNQLQKAMTTVVKGVGNLSHSDWRQFHSTRRNAPAKGFVDGD